LTKKPSDVSMPTSRVAQRVSLWKADDLQYHIENAQQESERQ
jgi:hypothetical protein